MPHTYKGILRGDRVEWLGDAPATDGGVPVRVTVLTERPAGESDLEARRRRVRAASGITCVEVLEFHRITPRDQTRLVQLFDELEIPDVDRPILKAAVSLRQQRKMSPGDAIVAATALVHGRELVTRNVEDFRWIRGLRLINPVDDPPRTPPSPPSGPPWQSP